MVTFDFVTLFPEMVLGAMRYSVLARAEAAGLLRFRAVSPRDFATDPHRTVDHPPFGGGPGMVLMPDLVERALLSWGSPATEDAIVVPDPCGELLSQSRVASLAERPRLVFLCGHYEGLDERVVERWATHRISIGDYVLTGGELPALVIADAVARYVPGVLGSEESLKIDAHADGLLSAPQYTRPANWNGMEVPEVLRSGDHGAIARWRRKQALLRTREHRPDLFCRARLEKSDLELLSS